MTQRPIANCLIEMMSFSVALVTFITGTVGKASPHPMVCKMRKMEISGFPSTQLAAPYIRRSASGPTSGAGEVILSPGEVPRRSSIAPTAVHGREVSATPALSLGAPPQSPATVTGPPQGQGAQRAAGAGQSSLYRAPTPRSRSVAPEVTRVRLDYGDIGVRPGRR